MTSARPTLSVNQETDKQFSDSGVKTTTKNQGGTKTGSAVRSFAGRRQRSLQIIFFEVSFIF